MGTPTDSPEVASRRVLERKLRSARLEIERRAYETDLLGFSKDAWLVVEPQTAFQSNWHHELVAEHLTLALQGKTRRLIINIPPQHTKSRLVSVFWPTWGWARKPGSAWIFTSYSHDLSVHQHSADRRKILESEWYADHWGNRVQLAEGENRQDEYYNNERGRMVATSVGGTITGKGADYIVVDDLLNPEQAASDADRETANRYFDQSLWTRQRDPRTSVFVIVMQRLHAADLVGHVLEEKTDQPWTVVDIQAEAEKRTTVTYPISGRVKTRERDELLWPERFNEKVLAEYKLRLGSWAYSAQFQQRATPAGGGVFKRAWWHFYGGPCPRCHGIVHGVPGEFNDVLQSWDLTFKDTEGADFVAGQVWGRRGADCFLLDRVLERMDLPATISAIQTMSGKWNGKDRPLALMKLVEDKANGPAVVATLQHQVPGLIPVDPAGGKLSRAHSVAPLVEAGNAYLPHPTIAPWVHDYIQYMSDFPKGAKDDDVDSTTQALRRLAGFGLPGEGFLQYLGAAVAEQEQRKGTVRSILRPGGGG